MPALSIFAGPHALRRIEQEGIKAGQFKVMVGASGGPKWFVLYGLDRYLFGEFFANRDQELITIGSSAGAWRMCCLACDEPVAAIERLAQLYSRERYSANPDAAEVSASARAMLSRVISDSGVRHIVNNRVFRTHVVADRCRGLGSSRRGSLQALSLGAAALLNTVNRKSLSLFFERTIFNNMGDLSPYNRTDDLGSQTAPLTETNLFEVMIASGSIPFVLQGVRDIEGAARGLYWDGGITDYHFDMEFHAGPELVLYPHFYPQLIPGWFDKHVPWRRIHEENFRNVVLVTPSREFVAELPNARIPDRRDFRRFDYQTRVRIWQEVLDRSHALAEEFALLVDTDAGLERIRPLSERSR